MELSIKYTSYVSNLCVKGKRKLRLERRRRQGKTAGDRHTVSRESLAMVSLEIWRNGGVLVLKVER